MLQIHFNIFQEFETISEPIKMIEAEPIKKQYKIKLVANCCALFGKSIDKKWYFMYNELVHHSPC